MNYTFCLDSYSANFNPSNLSGNGFSIYTNVDGFTVPIATNIPASSILSAPYGTCPYTLYNVPDGATQLLIVDQCDGAAKVLNSLQGAAIPSGSSDLPDTDCCYALIEIPDDCVGWCDECNIEFDTINLNSVGRLLAGNLESSCGTVTDYVIGWYRNGNYSAPEVTTGFGTTFSYQYPHPLTSTTAPLVLDGTYEGIIHDLIIGGTQYSNPESGSGVGTPIPFESCFGTVIVNALECDNGTFPLPYTHQISLTAIGNGVPIGPAASTYLLDTTTNYFAYEFSGFTVYDELEIKFISGDPDSTSDPILYSQPIYLEKAQIGTDMVLNNQQSIDIGGASALTSGVYPKQIYNSGGWKRTLSLTGLDRNTGDKLEIKITPNPSNPQTSWSLKLQCLETFDCELCAFDNPIPAPITSIEIDRIPLSANPCKLQRAKLQILTCPYTASDFWSTYIESSTFNGGPLNLIMPNNHYAIEAGTNCTAGQFSASQLGICSPIGSGTITFTKDNTVVNGLASNGLPLGKITMTFNNSNDYYHYKNNLQAAELSLQGAMGPIITDPTNYKYYTGYILKVPVGPTACGDGTTSQDYYIHRTAYPNIIYTENPSSNFWSLEIPMPEVIDGLVVSGCSNCRGGVYIGLPWSTINLFNSSSFHNFNQLSQTNNFSSKYTQPWAWRTFSTSSAPGLTQNNIAAGANATATVYSAETLPFISSSGSPTGWVILPNLADNPCPSYADSLPYGTNSGTSARYNYGYGYYYNVVWPNLNTNPDDFQIYSRVTNNTGTLTASPGSLIYQYIGGVATVIQPQFFVGGAPTLTIDPF
jgi:hypothetical protein